jgi:aminoglycoside phosphotransferase (APT) family kinase protein
VAEGELAAAAYVVEEALPGAQPTWQDEASRRRLAEGAAELIGGLHRATAEPMVAEALVEAWVRAPIRAIVEALEAAGDPHGARERANRLGNEISLALAANALGASLLHGDFWPGNLLEADGRITALVDWDSAHRGPASVDLVHLLLHLRRGSGARSIGETAADVLVAHPWDEDETAVLASAASSSLDARATVLLWWLDFAAGNLARIPHAAASPPWLARNVAVVLDAAEATR